jgi:hypothetical protein
LVLVHALQFADGVHQRRRHLPAQGDIAQTLIQDAREGQQVLAVVFQHATDRADAMGTEAFPLAKFLGDEGEQLAARGQIRAGRREDVVCHPVGHSANVPGQADGLGFGLTGQSEPSGETVPLGAFLRAFHLVFELATSGGAAGGAVLKVHGQLAQLEFGMEHIPIARDFVPPGGGLSGAKGLSAVGYDAFGMEALIAQVQQVNAPGRLVAMLLDGQQIAVRRADIGPDENRPTCLVDLIVRPDGNGREILGVVDAPRFVHCVADDVVDGPDADVAIVEDGIENLHHAPKRAAPDEHLRQNELAKPILGHRQMEQHAPVRLRGREGLIQRLGRLGRLVVDKLAADVVARCQVRHRLAAGQGLDRKVGPSGRPKLAGSRRRRRKGLRIRRRCVDERSNHSTDSFRCRMEVWILLSSTGAGVFIPPFPPPSVTLI